MPPSDPKVAMDSILAPYGLYSELIHEWNTKYGLLLAGSAAVAGHTGLFKPNNVDLWVHGDPKSVESNKLMLHLHRRGFDDYNKVPASVNPLLADKIHSLYKFTRADNDSYVNLYFTNAPLKDVFVMFDISICALYFDGEGFGSFHWSTEYHLRDRLIKSQHKYLSSERVAKYMNRKFIMPAETVINITARMDELSKTEGVCDKTVAALKERNATLVMLYEAAEAACKKRDETIEQQKEYIAYLIKNSTTARNMIETELKAKLEEKEQEITRLKEQIMVLARLTN